MLRFDGMPVPKGRPRARVVRGRAMLYTPAKTREFEDAVRLWARSTFSSPLSGALRLELIFEVTPPRSWSARKRAQAIAGEILPCVRPDLDNLAKSFIDGLNGVAFSDDGQLVEILLAKRYADAPGVLVAVSELKKPA